jgi:hypothetical protein
LSPSSSYRVRWLQSDYTPDPSEPTEGRLILPVGTAGGLRGVHADGSGGAFVAWEIERLDLPYGDYLGEIWMTRLLPSSLVGVTPRPTTALALSAPRPNPARGSVALDVTLPDDSPARVELLDVAGRVVRSQAV